MHENFKFRALKKIFTSHFIFFCCLTLLGYATFQPYLAQLNQLVRVRFDKSAVEAGQLIAVPSLIFTFLIPVIGYLSDRYFKSSRKLVIGLAFLALSLSHLIMFFSTDSQGIILSQSFYTLGYTTFHSNIWALLRQITSKPQRATAIGIANSL